MLVCDAANRLRRTVVVSEGAIDRSLVPVREILNAVLRHDGRAFDDLDDRRRHPREVEQVLQCQPIRTIQLVPSR